MVMAMMSGSMPQAAVQALLYDALLAGLETDVGENLAVWGSAIATLAPMPLAMTPAGDVPPQPAATPMAMPVVIPVAAPQVAPKVVVEPVWRLWHAGEPNGVVVVLAEAKAPKGVALALLENMLRAVGLGDVPVGFVGLEGDAPKGGLAEPMAAEVATLAPRYTLLMGQGVLGAMCGKIMSVEGWHAAPQILALQGIAGVTYPLSLLMNKPLFKGLAWQHLQRWRLAFGGG